MVTRSLHICHFSVKIVHAEAHGVDVCSQSSGVENSWYDPFKPLSISENQSLDHSQEMVISESLKWDDLWDALILPLIDTQKLNTLDHSTLYIHIHISIYIYIYTYIYIDTHHHHYCYHYCIIPTDS